MGVDPWADENDEHESRGGQGEYSDEGASELEREAWLRDMSSQLEARRAEFTTWEQSLQSHELQLKQPANHPDLAVTCSANRVVITTRLRLGGKLG